jgi:chemotaxis protein CheZ
MNEGSDTEGVPGDMLVRVGHLTRVLHDSLQALGLDRVLVRAAEEFPDARDRLDYVARMTEQAAQKVLNATDEAIPLQDEMIVGANELESDWAATLAQPFSEERYREMAVATMQWAKLARHTGDVSKQHLMDIMMAQDFQDLTGQVIKKVIALAHDMETQLVQLLLDYAPQEMKAPEVKKADGLLNGPQVTASADSVSSQGQVDDLLESLGF